VKFVVNVIYYFGRINVNFQTSEEANTRRQSKEAGRHYKELIATILRGKSSVMKSEINCFISFFVRSSKLIQLNWSFEVKWETVDGCLVVKLGKMCKRTLFALWYYSRIFLEGRGVIKVRL
jgi:hypothetical protein